MKTKKKSPKAARWKSKSFDSELRTMLAMQGAGELVDWGFIDLSVVKLSRAEELLVEEKLTAKQLIDAKYYKTQPKAAPTLRELAAKSIGSFDSMETFPEIERNPPCAHCGKNPLRLSEDL